MAKMRNVGIILAVVTIILFGTQCRHEAVETDVERSVNPGAVFSPMKSVVGSFDIIIDTDSFTWSSAGSPMTNRLYNVNNVGPIGTFILYTDGSWELLEMEDELHWYGIPFDPENDSFFDALEWGSIPSVITNFLANEDMVADVPLTVTFPAFVDNAGVYAAYTMGIRVSGNGVELLWSADEVDVLEPSISYAPLLFSVVPVDGVAVFSPMKSVVGSFDIVIDTDSFTWSSARSPMTNRLYNVNNVGPIGTFILYTDGSWELLEMEDELHWYGISFDPENDSFFDALEWGSIPSVITNFLANEDMVADVPLTVTFPAFVDNAGVYAAYTMGIRVSGNGVELLWSADEVDVLEPSISYAPLLFSVVPVDGVCEEI